MMWGTGVGWAFFWMSLVWVVAVMLVAFVVTRLASGPTRDRSDVMDARRILDERLARGEIDEEEYRRRIAALDV